MHETLLIQGGTPLEGTVEVRGSKNAASKMMIASLLTDAPCSIENIPLSSEIDITKELCETIGSMVQITPNHECRIETKTIRTSEVPELNRKNRIPILATGPLLHRKGYAEIPVLGGCPIGHRPINLHLEALNKLGVHIERKENSYVARADEIRGADIEFAYPSVGATENILLTAVMAKGTTTIRNAAVEPEIENLVAMLNAMGAEIISHPEQRMFEIHGVTHLHGVRVRVMPDRNEVVSFVSAALATHGKIFIPDISPEPLTTFLSAIKKIGAIYTTQENGMFFESRPRYQPVIIETAPHPGFMTDWQQPFCIVLTQADGTSIIHETVYEDRFGYTKDVRRMGAHIEVSDECLGTPPCRFQGQTFNHSARITGPTPLHATEIAMPDIRAGMAHIIAALTAQGESHVTGVVHIDRGYEKIDERLRALGARIQRK